MSNYKICTELEQVKSNYDTTIQIVEGLNFRQKDVVTMVEFYSNSKYLNGQRDELGREKPFYNILNAMCDVENAAKDINTSDITATSDDGEHYTESFLMTKDIYEWMKKVNFAKTLNDIRDTHSRYGSVLVKKKIVKDKDGKSTIKIEMPEWKNVMTDQVDIPTGTIVEIHYMTPREIMKMEGWINKEEAIKAVNKEYSKRISVYEIRGEFPRSWVKEMDGGEITGDDETDFSYQLYYLAGAPKSMDEAGDWEVGKLTPLYWEDNTEEVYKYLARKKKSGRAFGTGIFEEGEEAQIGTNDAVLKQMRAMEFTTKSISQTASKKLKGRNVLTEVDDGQILEHEDNKPIIPVNLLPSGGLGQYQNLIEQWYVQFEKTTSAYAAQRGEAPPSGTPFRLQAAVLQQSSSVFKNLQQELGILITEIFEDWIMPHLASELNREHILAHEFSMEELKEIDKNFATKAANDEAKRLILGGQIITFEDYEVYKQLAAESRRGTKSQRFLDVPENYYKKFKAKITVNVTGEQRNKATTLESLINIMTVYAQNPSIGADPVLMQIFTKIVELSGAGISPVSLVAALQERAEMIKKQQEMQAQQQAQGQEPQEQPQELSLAANPV